ncbi:hypothetical protein RRG08_003536 [Elysia crispata]|uniref:Uncharacterized protein n=1 Tax=Elysia crispata TaxID=231223 RepID=A0AAE0Y6X3_9GAST|nr:hypothetical protein RRG08_003536 [Elysia crispata]
MTCLSSGQTLQDTRTRQDPDQCPCIHEEDWRASGSDPMRRIHTIELIKQIRYSCCLAGPGKGWPRDELFQSVVKRYKIAGD